MQNLLEIGIPQHIIDGYDVLVSNYEAAKLFGINESTMRKQAKQPPHAQEWGEVILPSGLRRYQQSKIEVAVAASQVAPNQ